MRGFVFDAGAFIGLERRAPLMLGIFDEALRGRVEVILPRTVIAQVWRGTPRQANVSRLISAGLGRGSPVVIDELTPERARQVGVTIGQTRIRTSWRFTSRWWRPNEDTPSSRRTTPRLPTSTGNSCWCMSDR